jgi:EAL domain-containing protein (putative c-di-GMP-specific phosphodiesterase class I)
MQAASFQSTCSTEAGLASAAEQGLLSLAYQAQVRSGDRAVIGFEALLRWDDPVHGAIQPSSLVPQAERSGLIHSIGLWAIEEACQQCRRWRRGGLPRTKVAVNVSPLQLTRVDFARKVSRILAASDMPAGDLELELTESYLLSENVHAAEILQLLRAMGVKLALDDFGTGYATLSNLKLHTFDKLKLDRTFVEGLPAESGCSTLVRTIVNLAHEFDMNVVAEGVETEEQFSALRRLRCDAVQGYLISRPLPPAAVPGFLRTSQVSAALG